MLHRLIFVVFLWHFAVLPQSHAFDTDQEVDVQLSQKVVEECLQSCTNISWAQLSVKVSNGRSCYQKCLRRNRIATFLGIENPKSFYRRIKRDVSTCQEDSMLSNDSVCWGISLKCKDSTALLATGLRVSFHEINKTGKFYANLSWDPLKRNSVEWKGYQLFYLIVGKLDNQFQRKCKRFGKNVTQYIVKDPDLELEEDFEFQLAVTSYPLADASLIAENMTTCRVPTYCPRTAFSTPSTTGYPKPNLPTSGYTVPLPTSGYSKPNLPTSGYTVPLPTSGYTVPLPTSGYTVPLPTSGNKGVTILIVTACATAVTSLSLLFWRYLRSKKNILNRYEIKTNEGEDQYIAKYYHKPLHFEYDAFIIYSTKDQEWVRTTLLPTLEQKHGLKCCIHYRNFAPGVLYRENMVNSVYKSRKTVAVVSPNFFSSGFCESEFEYALRRLTERRDNSLIVIKLDDVDEDKFPMELKQRSYIDCPRSVEKETWERKLVNCLKVN